MTKSVREDRKNYWAKIATSMEQASNVGDTRELYQFIRQASVSSNPPSEAEIADAIKRLRNNKATGKDGILGEIYKSCADTLISGYMRCLDKHG
ncbi:unnamed protein product [Dibothriocephalus latus]|uniref:Reverse transcriptase domain-containing protein n=1 Tax=Dibothriocephalus latus TaxID=60516 RepID=A0A3P7NZF6_DIBLA|nr:unnamed protein product [Dibothriocephalus latus]